MHPLYRGLSGFIAKRASKWVGLASLLLLAACGGSNNNINTQDVGGFRVINAVSDSPSLTFFLEGSNLGARSFGQASNFTLVREGRFDISSRYSTLDGQTVTVLDEERIRVEVGEQTTLVLAGTMAAPLPIVIEAVSPDLTNDVAELQLLNTSSAGTVDLYVTGPTDALDSPLTTVAGNAVSIVLATTAGQRRIRLTQSGSSNVIFDSGSFTLPGGERILLHARPYFGPGDAVVDLSVIDSARTSSFPQAAQPSAVRIANAIGDLPAADVQLTSNGAATTVTSLASNSFSDAFQFEPGPIEINVSMETDPATVFVSDNSLLVGGERRTLIAAGNFADNSTTGRLAVDPQRPISTNAQLNFLHGSVSAGRVDAYVLTGDGTTADTTIAVPDLPLLGNSNLDVLAGTYSVLFTRQGETETLAGPVTITVTTNQLSSILLTDADGGGQPPQIILGSNFE